MIEVSGVRLSLDQAYEATRRVYTRVVCRACGIKPADVRDIELTKRSVDARKKSDVHITASFAVTLADEVERDVLARAQADQIALPVRVKVYEPYVPMDIPQLTRDDERRIVVVGTGPAGLFAAWYLAQAGLKPYVIERGQCVDDRLKTVDAFNAGGPLNPESNIQFGEGGAGTFSDGKLTTNTKNPRVRDVLHIFVEAGAPREILWQAKPHIGTDLLINVVKLLREQIIAAGGEVHFNTRLDDIEITDGALSAVFLHAGEVSEGAGEQEEYRVPCSHLVLAMGHSARDTFSLLHERRIPLEPKPFSVGVRVEHPQRLINESQYGKAAHHPALGAADYKLSVHTKSGRGVYTFCMCPGGEVVCATSETGGVVVNGMSRHARDGKNANAALLVGIDPEDYGGSETDPLAGVRFQQTLEHAAYDAVIAAGGKAYQAPAQHVGSFMGTGATMHESVCPTYARGVVMCDLHTILPDFVCQAMQEAFPILDRRLHGYAQNDAIMTGVETRSSSPVRILRNKDYESDVRGIYPTGEGAGYAGGIMSAAVDGLRVAQHIVEQLNELTR